MDQRLVAPSADFGKISGDQRLDNKWFPPKSTAHDGKIEGAM
jgi:hypothetical protein